MAKRGDPSVLRLVVIFLRSFARMTQAEFGKECRVDQAQVSRYEKGREAPSEEILGRMAKVARIDWSLVVHLRQFYSSLLAAASVGRPDAMAPDLTRVEPSLLALTPYLIELGRVEPEWQIPEKARQEADQIWSALEEFPIQRRGQLIGLSIRASRSWALAERVSHESERMAAHKVEDALELAKLALSIAERVPGEEGLRSQGYCWGHVANARRVANDHSGADEAFTRTWELWRKGDDSGPESLAEWRLYDLEASLRRDERRFSESLELLDQARAACGDDPIAIGRILLKKEHVFEQMGDLPNALAALAEATPFVEASGDSRQLFALRFNMVDDLCHLERYEEAAKLLPQVREMAVQQSNELDILRLLWLSAKVAAGQGRMEEAITGLEQVSRDFQDRDMPYDAALSSLDLAVLWLKAGRTAEVRELAVAMGSIFKAKKIDREALASLRLFCDAARQETATVELALSVITEIEQVRRSASPPSKGRDRE